VNHIDEYSINIMYTRSFPIWMSYPSSWRWYFNRWNYWEFTYRCRKGSI